MNIDGYVRAGEASCLKGDGAKNGLMVMNRDILDLPVITARCALTGDVPRCYDGIIGEITRGYVERVSG